MRPTHPWNDPDDDGHNCADCPEVSIWKCDRAAHPGGILPPLTPIEGLDVHSANDLLSPEKKAELDANLRAMARTRRAGNAAAATMPLVAGQPVAEEGG